MHKASRLGPIHGNKQRTRNNEQQTTQANIYPVESQSEYSSRDKQRTKNNKQGTTKANNKQRTKI